MVLTRCRLLKSLMSVDRHDQAKMVIPVHHRLHLTAAEDPAMRLTCFQHNLSRWEPSHRHRDRLDNKIN